MRKKSSLQSADTQRWMHAQLISCNNNMWKHELTYFEKLVRCLEAFLALLLYWLLLLPACKWHQHGTWGSHRESWRSSLVWTARQRVLQHKDLSCLRSVGSSRNWRCLPRHCHCGRLFVASRPPVETRTQSCIHHDTCTLTRSLRWKEKVKKKNK